MGFGKKFWGSSKNKKVSTQTKAQRTAMDGYLNAINANSQRNVDTVQGYADEGYNPYDEAQGNEVYGNLQDDVNVNRREEIDAVRGGPMNRFSLGSQASVNNINRNATEQRNQLALNQLQNVTNANQQAYGNQMGALASIDQNRAAMLGLNAFQNQTKVKEGWFNRINKVSGMMNDSANSAANLIGSVGSIMPG